MGTAKRGWFDAAVLVFGLAGSFFASPGGGSRGDAAAAEAPAGAVLAGDSKKSVEASDVYVGDSKKWEKPAEVDADKVYAKIDEYKQIVDGGLKPGDAKYDILMSKAGKRFLAALKKTAKDAGYDLVAKLGAVKGVATPPNVTADAIANL